MIGNLDSVKVLVFLFAITLLTSLAASTEGGIDQVELEPKTLGPGDEKIVTIVNVSDDGGEADGEPDNKDLYIDYLRVANSAPDETVLGSEIQNISIWTHGKAFIESNVSHQLNSKDALLGSQDGESIHTVSDDSSEILTIKVEMDSNISVDMDGTGIRLTPSAWATTDGSAFSGHSAGYTPNTSFVDARPEISSATTLDQNGNGKIDAINVSFTESVQLQNSESDNTLPGISVRDYNLENHDYNGEKGEYHVIHIKEADEGDTGATPQVSYDEGTNTIVDADQLENELRSTGGVTPSDGAAPVADVSYENDGSDVNYIDVEFSEPVKSHSILDANDWSWQNPGELNQIYNTSLSWDQETPEREFRIDILNGAGKTNLGDTTLEYTDNGNIGDGVISFSGKNSPYSLEDEASPSLIQSADLIAKDKVQVNFSEQVDGAGDLLAGDFNFTGSQNIETVSGTVFTSQVNITFSENLESSNLGSNTIDGPEGDSVGVEENSVQDRADNYAELDPVGLSDPQGLIDSTSSIKINPTAFSGGCTIKKEGSEGSCNSADGIMVQLSDSGGAYDVRESTTFRINSSNGKSLNVSPVFSDPDTTSLDAYGLVFNRIYDSEGSLYQADGETPEIRVFRTDIDSPSSSKYYNSDHYNETAVEFSGDTGMFQDEVIQEYRVELIEDGEVVGSTGPRAYGIGYEGQFSQNKTEVRFNKDGGINVENWYVNLLLYKDDPWVRDDRVEIEKTRNGNFVLPKNKIDAPEGKYNWSFQVWPEGNRQGSNRTVHVGGEGGENVQGQAGINIETERQECDLNVSDSDATFSSIQGAITDASEGQKVCVYEGVYDERIDLNKNITLKGFDANITSDSDIALDITGGKPVIKNFQFVGQGSESKVRIGGNSAPILQGLTVYFGGEGDWALEADETMGDWAIKDSKFIGGSYTAIFAQGTQGDFLMDNITVLDVQNTSEDAWGHGIVVEDSTGNWAIEDSRIDNVTGNGIDGYSVDGADIRNTEIYNTGLGGINLYNAEGFADIENVEIYNTGEEGISFGDSISADLEDMIVNNTGGDGIKLGDLSSANVSDTRIYNTDENGVNLFNAESSGEIRNVTIKNINNSGDYAAINLGKSTGDWKVVESIITNGTGNGVSAWKAADIVNVSYNYWGASDGPSGYEGGEDYNSHYTDGSGGEADFNVTVRPYYKDEDKTQLSSFSEGQVDISDFRASYEDGYLIAEVEADQLPESANISVEESTDNHELVDDANFDLEASDFENAATSDGSYHVANISLSNYDLSGAYSVELRSYNSQDLENVEDEINTSKTEIRSFTADFRKVQESNVDKYGAIEFNFETDGPLENVTLWPEGDPEPEDGDYPTYSLGGGSTNVVDYTFEKESDGSYSLELHFESSDLIEDGTYDMSIREVNGRDVNSDREVMQTSFTVDKASITGFDAKYTEGESNSEDIQGTILMNFSTTETPESMNIDLGGLDFNFEITQFKQFGDDDGFVDDPGPSWDYGARIPIETDLDVSNGNHSLEIVEVNGAETSSYGDTQEYVNIGGPPVIDDFFFNTSTGYSVNAAFNSSILDIRNSKGSYNLTDSDGNVVRQGVQDKVNSTGLSEGRYELVVGEDMITQIDLFDTDSDVVSRIANFSSDPDVSVYSYRTAEKIKGNSVNVSDTSSWPDAEGSETVFEMNISSELENYWLEIEGDQNTLVRSSRLGKSDTEYRKEDCDDDDKDTLDDSDGTSSSCGGGSSGVELTTPFVQDFQPEDSYNVTGNVRLDRNQTYEDVQVVLKGFEIGEEGGLRYPFRRAPPTITALTNSTGGFKFENVPEGDYSFGLGNESFVRTDVVGTEDSFRDDIIGDLSYENDISVFDDKEVTVVGTNETGTFNLSVEAQDDFFYGYEILKDDSQQLMIFSEPGIGEGKEITLPEGKYSPRVIGFPKDSQTDERFRELETVNISENKTVNRSVVFKDNVYINGTINGESFGEDEYAYVKFEKEEGFQSYYSRIDGDSYSVQVPQDENYTVEFNPPYDSDYQAEEEDVWINDTGTKVNFTVDSGKYVAGDVEANGDPVNAQVTVYNYSKDIYKEGRTFTSGESEGSFNLTGLKEGGYNIEVEPLRSEYRFINKDITVNGEGKELETFDVGRNLTELNVSVQVNSDSDEELRVSIFSDQISESKRKEIDPNSTAEFEVPQGTTWDIKVDSRGSDLSGAEASVKVDEDKEVDLTVVELVDYEALVRTDDGDGVEAYVYAYNDSRDSRDSVRADESGEFELELKDVPHKVEVWPHPRKEDLPYKETNITVDDISGGNDIVYSTQDLNLTYMAGNVTGPNNEPIEGVIAAWNESERSSSYQELENGSYNLTGLQNVTHNLWIRSKNQSIPMKKTTVDPGDVKTKDYSLGSPNSEQRTLSITVNPPRETLPEDEPAVVSTSSQEKRTNASGKVEFELTEGTSEKITVDRPGWTSAIDTVSIVPGQGDITREYTLNRTDEYDVQVNVTEPKTGDQIDSEVVVTFVSKDNQSSKGGITTFPDSEPVISGLTVDDYLVSVSGENEYENATAASIPKENPLNHEGSLNITDSSGEPQYTVDYEVVE